MLHRCAFALALCSAAGTAVADSPAWRWVGTWATAPQPEPAAKDNPVLTGTTVRQVLRVSLGGHQLRLRLSNAFGETPLDLAGVHLALAGPDGTIRPETDRAVLFRGQTSVSLPPGTLLLSDPLDFDLPALAEVAVSLQCRTVPATLTEHPGSRTTSYVQAGDALAAPALPGATKVEHWYFINGIDVPAAAPAAALAALGDSITDGRGSTTDHNNRWTDALAQRLHESPATGPVGVLNEGIGGNRLLRDGLGPRMLDRFDRDVLDQTAVRWVIVQAGINDIGTGRDARKRGQPYATAADIIGAYEQLIDRAHARGVQIFGSTISPYAGADFYWSAEGEADRQTVNRWIRSSGRFDAVIDFDAALRDPQNPTHLAAAFDSGDHLHPSPAGYVEMARTVDLSRFTRPAATAPTARP